MEALSKRRILVAVTGGIAAYKAAELVRLLVKAGAEVRVVMTAAAQKFITPLTLQALSQHPVSTDTFDLQQEATIGHIELADWAELLVVAPTTANAIAQLGQGLAGDLFSTIALACRAPLLLAPAMNVNMWNHAATQSNLRLLVERGAATVGPEAGELACGWQGAGRMAEPASIVQACRALLGPRDLEGKKFLITAGPTHEPIDPVRFLANRSSGKMGFALARQALRRGAEVTLIAGPTDLAAPQQVERIDVVTAAQMRDYALDRAAAVDAVIMAAAVADFRVATPATEKIKKADARERWALELERNPDILSELGSRSYERRPLLVGFAAETQQVAEYAAAKLQEKRCDLIVANDVSQKDAGFEVDTNRVLLVEPGRTTALPFGSKDEVASGILDWMAARLSA